MSSDVVLFDSDAFVGLIVGNDAHHRFMKEYISQLFSQHIMPMTTSSVIFETATLLSKRYHHTYAQKFLEFLETSLFEVIDLTSEQRIASQELFKELEKAHNSLVDCSNVVVATSLGIHQMASFDRFYERYELEILAH